MTVYIVQWYDGYNSSRIEGVFETEELAKAAVEEWGSGCHSVQEFEVHKMPKRKSEW